MSCLFLCLGSRLSSCLFLCRWAQPTSCEFLLQGFWTTSCLLLQWGSRTTSCQSLSGLPGWNPVCSWVDSLTNISSWFSISVPTNSSSWFPSSPQCFFSCLLFPWLSQALLPYRQSPAMLSCCQPSVLLPCDWFPLLLSFSQPPALLSRHQPPVQLSFCQSPVLYSCCWLPVIQPCPLLRSPAVGLWSHCRSARLQSWTCFSVPSRSALSLGPASQSLGFPPETFCFAPIRSVGCLPEILGMILLLSRHLPLNLSFSPQICFPIHSTFGLQWLFKGTSVSYPLGGGGSQEEDEESYWLSYFLYFLILCLFNQLVFSVYSPGVFTLSFVKPSCFGCSSVSVSLSFLCYCGLACASLVILVCSSIQS